MEYTVGQIVEGKVRSLTKFGAFVSLPGGATGLVHISEVANTFVSDVGAFLKVGQEVSVKVIGIDENGRINLSVKKALPPSEPRPAARPAAARPAPAPAVPESFEDKLKQFMKESDSKMNDLNRAANRRSGRKK